MALADLHLHAVGGLAAAARIGAARAKLPGFSFRFAEPWLDVIVDDDGVTVKTTKGTERFDA